MKDEVKWARNYDAPHRLVDGEGLIVSTEAGRCLVVNRVGYAVWNFLENERTLAALVADIAKLYGKAEDEVASEVGRFLHQLKDLGLVKSLNDA